MKKSLTILALSIAILAPTGLRAEDKPAGEGARPGRGERRAMDPEARLKFMTEKLGLTEEQQGKVKAIQEKNAPKYKELMAKGRENLTDDDKTKFRELMKGQMEEIDALLTPEQKVKAKELREKGRERFGGGEKKTESK